MVKIGNIKLDGIPKIVLTVSDRENTNSVKSYNIDILEIRVDQFGNLAPTHIRDTVKSRREIGPPLILTIRNKNEGGQRKIRDEQRLKIFKENISFVDAVDIELKSAIASRVIKLAKKNKKAVIVSWHNFKLTPNNKILKDILDKAKKIGADIVKIAAKANKTEDFIRLIEFTRNNRNKNIITISLGNIGSMSRLLFPMLGSLMTYTYINRPSGPGQVPVKILQEHLRLYYPKYNHAFISKSALA